MRVRANELKSVLRRVARLTLLAGVVAGMQGCKLTDDLEECPPAEEYLLYIKAVDAATGADITTTGEMEDARVYIFDRNEALIRHYEVPASQIINRKPIVIDDPGLMQMRIEAWGNTQDQIRLSAPAKGQGPEQGSVTLLPHPTDEGYDLRPGDIFHGHSRLLPAGKGDTHTREVTLTRKTGRLHVTVRGLDAAQAGAGHFRVFHRHNGYDFAGAPLGVPSIIKERGEVRDNGDYVSPAPWPMVHSADPGRPSETNSVYIGLFDGERELIGADRDTAGNYIVLSAGHTTYVLLQVDESGRLSVHVRVTPWDEVWQWTEY